MKKVHRASREMETTYRAIDKFFANAQQEPDEKVNAYFANVSGEELTDPDVPDAQKQNLYVKRGGAYYSPAVRCRSAQRNYGDGDTPQEYTGLRVVMEVSGR